MSGFYQSKVLILSYYFSGAFYLGGVITGYQIIDLRDTYKSQYFAIIKLTNCFIIRPPSFFSCLIHSLTAQGSDLTFFKQECSYNYAPAVEAIIC